MYPTVKPRWKELSYGGTSEGDKPILEYHPVEKENANKVGRIHVSVSHDGEYVYSSVLIEGLIICDNIYSSALIFFAEPTHK